MALSQLKIRGHLQIKGHLAFTGSTQPPVSSVFWSFGTPSIGTTLNNFVATTSNASTYTINWGDNTSNVVASNATISHTY